MGHVKKFIENRLDIPQIVHQIGKDDEIECFVGNVILYIRMNAVNFRVPVFSVSDHLTGQINPYPVGRI